MFVEPKHPPNFLALTRAESRCPPRGILHKDLKPYLTLSTPSTTVPKLQPTHIRTVSYNATNPITTADRSSQTQPLAILDLIS